MVSRPMSCAREAFLADDVRDDRREADGEFVWLRYTHADAQRVLGICVNHEDFFALPRKPDSEARRRETFPAPSYNKDTVKKFVISYRSVTVTA